MKGKHEGNYNPYLEQRDQEFMHAYRKAVKELLDTKGSFSLEEALNIARNSSTSRFFVSEQRASEIIKDFECYLCAVEEKRKNPESDVTIPEDPMRRFLYQRKRMYQHLFIVYKKLKAEEPNTPHEELVVMACATKADEFYMTIQSARSIHGRIVKNLKDFGLLTSRSSSRLKRDIKKGRIRL